MIVKFPTKIYKITDENSISLTIDFYRLVKATSQKHSISINFKTSHFLFFRTLNRVMKEIFLDWSNSDLIEEWKIIARYSRFYSTVNFTIYIMAIFSFYPILIFAYITEPPQGRKMFFKAAYPFDYLKSPTYEITTMIQISQGIPVALADSVTQTLFVTLVNN